MPSYYPLGVGLAIFWSDTWRVFVYTFVVSMVDGSQGFPCTSNESMVPKFDNSIRTVDPVPSALPTVLELLYAPVLVFLQGLA